jgi:RNA polymerase sigma-70 factor (ECF subfamily)
MHQGWLDDPDIRLMMDVKGDRPGAFERLVAQYSDVLVSFLWRQSGNQDDAEDLAQEVLAKVYRARHRYEPAARLRTWLMTIATNLYLNRRRYESHRPHQSLGPVADRGDGEGPAIADERASTPDAELETDELRERVRRAVAGLPANQRLAVTLLRFEGLAYVEIAEAMQLSVQAVKSLLNRAKENLREALSREIDDRVAGRRATIAGEG